MLQEIQSIIAKNLPAEVGETLRKRLEQADSLERANKSLGEELQQVKERLKKQEEINFSLGAELREHADLKVREEAVTRREIRQELFEAKLKAEEAEKRASEIAGLVQTVFKSPVYRKAYMNDLFSSCDAQGRYTTTGGIPHHETTTEE